MLRAPFGGPGRAFGSILGASVPTLSIESGFEGILGGLWLHFCGSSSRSSISQAGIKYPVRGTLTPRLNMYQNTNTSVGGSSACTQAGWITLPGVRSPSPRQGRTLGSNYADAKRGWKGLGARGMSEFSYWVEGAGRKRDERV